MKTAVVAGIEQFTISSRWKRAGMPLLPEGWAWSEHKRVVELRHKGTVLGILNENGASAFFPGNPGTLPSEVRRNQDGDELCTSAKWLVEWHSL